VPVELGWAAQSVSTFLFFFSSFAFNLQMRSNQLVDFSKNSKYHFRTVENMFSQLNKILIESYKFGLRGFIAQRRNDLGFSN
jgi:hypothetical protein